MNKHPAIDNVQREFDLLEGKMNSMYLLGKRVPVAANILDYYSKRIDDWTDGYMKALVDIRTAKGDVYFKATGRLAELVDEGLALHEEFRTICLNENAANLEKLKREREEMDEAYKRQYPILSKIENFFRNFQKK